MNVADVLAAIDRAAGASPAYAVIGAVARNAWAPPRATTDLDLTVAARHDVVQSIARALEGLGYRRVRQHQADAADELPDILIFRADLAELRQIDLLIAKTSFEEQVLRRAVAVDVGARAIPVASPEDLVVYKLLADRPRDRDDIRAVLRTQARAGRPFDWGHVGRWAAFWQIADRLDRLRDESNT